jgi:N-methylhydantoinase A
LNVPIDSRTIGAPALLQAKERFHRAHQKAYGFSRPDERIEGVNLRVTCIGKIPSIRLQKGESGGRDPEEALKGMRPVFFHGKWVDTKIVSREKLRAGNRIEGPAVIEEMGSTTLIEPGDAAQVDPYGNIEIEIRDQTGA